MNEFWSVTIFWLFVLVAVVLALAFVLPWLMRRGNAEQTQAARRDINLAIYRDQMQDLKAEYAQGLISEEQYLATKRELEMRTAEDAVAQEDLSAVPKSGRRLGYGLAAVIPVATIALYAWLGEPNALMVSAHGPQSAQAGPPTEADLMQIIQRMEQSAQANPNDLENWETLANAYAMLSRWPEALQAFEKAFALAPNQASVLSGYAEALAMTGDMLMVGRPMELVNRALQADPNDRKGLELSAIHAFQSEEFLASVQYLDRLLRLVSLDMPYAQEILRMRNEAVRLASANNGALVAGRVVVAPELVSQIRPDSTIYLIARDGETGPPVAAARFTVGAFPLSFRLDDSMAMNPANRLSDHQNVVLLARISASGTPAAQSGDLEGRMVGVTVGSTDVQLVIDRVLP